MATEHNIRVSDADRDFTAAQLREHYAQGRLTLDELHERLDRAFTSRTGTDLNAVTSDLPYAVPSGVLPSDGVRHGSSGPSGRAGQGWNRRDWNGPGQGGRSGDYHHRYGRRCSGGSFLRILPVLLAVWACFALLGVFGFGFGGGPSVVVIVLAVLSAIRWIFGRRRRGPARPARRGGRGRPF